MRTLLPKHIKAHTKIKPQTTKPKRETQHYYHFSLGEVQKAKYGNHHPEAHGIHLDYLSSPFIMSVATFSSSYGKSFSEYKKPHTFPSLKPHTETV